MSDRDLTTGIIEKLRAHYIPESKDWRARRGGEFAHEVSVNGQWGNGRRCDALYAGFTSASGRILIGHEVKVSRSDWRAELAKTGKADYWADACHAWYIVAPSTTIVPPDELPEAWGLMIPPRAGAKRFKVVKKAAVKTDHSPPWDAVRSFMARLDTLEHSAVAEAVAETAKNQREIWQEQVEVARSNSLSPTNKSRLDCLSRLEDLLGVKVNSFDGWDADDFGAGGQVSPEILAHAIKLARSLHRIGPERRSIEFTVRDLDGLKERLQAVGDALQKIAQIGSGTDE